MTEKQFQKRYIEKNNKVYDTWKEMSITDELKFDNLLNLISHLNGLGEMIDIKIEQGRYYIRKYNELKEENEDLVTKKEDAEYELLHLKEKYEELLEENKELKSLIKNMGELGGFNKHMIRTICDTNGK